MHPRRGYSRGPRGELELADADATKDRESRESVDRGLTSSSAGGMRTRSMLNTGVMDRAKRGIKG